MGNQCCAASQTVPDQVGSQTTPNYTPIMQVQTEEDQQNTLVNERKEDAKVHAQVVEQDDAAAAAAKQTEIKMKEQIAEDKQNQVVVAQHVFKKQLDSLKKAMGNAENLKKIADYGKKMTQAIAELDIVIQLFSQTVQNTSYIREFKTEIIGLYGDLQMFRSFHLRYTIDEAFFSDLSVISDIARIVKNAYVLNTKDNKTNYEGLAKELQSGDSTAQFEAAKAKLSKIRDQFNKVSGQNFSKLPNYLYVTFNQERGFALWTQLFPNDFEVSNQVFSEKYAAACGVKKEEVLQIITLLDNANDQRVDIYQWTDFVKEYSEFLDKQDKILPDKIASFATQISSYAYTMKIAPEKDDDGTYIYNSGITFKGTLDQDNKRQGSGTLKDEGYVYEGEFLNDLPNGSGKETRRGIAYEGSFASGYYSGSGKLTFPNGRQYIGNFLNHQYNGQGELTGDDGVKYEGTWKAGNLDFGKITYHDGSHYIGQIGMNIFKHGKGSLHIVKPSFTAAPAQSDKTTLSIEGTWEKDTPVSAKVYSFLETVLYDGTLNNWAITGKGKRLYVDGSYDGELLRDKKNNDGILTFKNGDKFNGKWVEDQQVKGSYSYAKEKDHSYDGEWKNGQMTGKGKFTYSSGGLYEGDVVEGKRQGKGTYKYRNGNKYEGQWVDNNQEGEGKFCYSGANPGEEGDIYSGQFKKGKFNGFGHYFYRKSGKQYIGFWEEDKWSGEGKFLGADGKVAKSGVWKNDHLEKEKVEADLIIPENLKNLIMKNLPAVQPVVQPAAGH